MVQSVRSRLIQLTVSSSRGLPCTWKSSYKCTQTLFATFWSRERLLHMLCFQLYPRPSRPRDGRCRDWKMTVEVSAQVSQQPNTTVILTEMLIFFAFLPARAIVANYARHQNKLRHRCGCELNRECNPYLYKWFLLRLTLVSTALLWSIVNIKMWRTNTFILVVDCKTVRIFSYSSTRVSQTKGLERGWKQRARLARDADSRFLCSLPFSRFAHVRLFNHTLPMSLLILRKKRLFCSLYTCGFSSLSFLFSPVAFESRLRRQRPCST